VTTRQTLLCCSRRGSNRARRARSRSAWERRSSQRLGGALERTDVAGPRLPQPVRQRRWLTDALGGVIAAGLGVRRGGAGRSHESINLEFVSANPTGPVHIGHARGAAYGDALARLLGFRGFDVTREFYVNDYGSQVRKLGESVRALALGEPVPEDGYHGDYVATLVPAERARTLDIDELSREALAACLAQIKGLARALRRQLRRLVLGALAARQRRGRGGARASSPSGGDV
jgi:arginyl-tRNA synthetase